MTPLLQVEGLRVAYGGVTAVRDLTLDVGEGEIVALLGANGAGKTSTLRAISGLAAPAGGSITFAGEPIAGFPPHRLVSRGISLLPEGRDLFPSLTVIENLRYGHWSKRRDRAHYSEQLELVLGYFPRLNERRSQPAGTLSGGEQQMLGVARALMPSPKLLLIDELSLGLAPLIVQQLFEILARVRAAGTAVLLVEQFVHMALEHSNRAYVLTKGEVAVSGPSDELADDPAVAAAYLGSHAPV